MVATGFAWFAHELVLGQRPLPWTLGRSRVPLHLAVAYLLLAFPDGRLRVAPPALVTVVAILDLTVRCSAAAVVRRQQRLRLPREPAAGRRERALRV